RHITGSDYQRTQNQALLILSTLSYLRSAGTSPTDTLKYLGILTRHTTLEGMSTPDLYRLARVGLGIDPAAVKSVLVPSSGATIGGASFLGAADDAAGLLSDLADDAALAWDGAGSTPPLLPALGAVVPCRTRATQRRGRAP